MLPLPKEHNSLARVTEEMMDSVQGTQLAILQNQQDLKDQLATAATELSTKLNRSVEQNEQLLLGQQLALQNQQTLLAVAANVSMTVDDVGVGGPGKRARKKTDFWCSPFLLQTQARVSHMRRELEDQQASTMQAFHDIRSALEMVVAVVVRREGKRKAQPTTPTPPSPA